MKRPDSGEHATVVVPRDELAPPASAEAISDAELEQLRRAENERPTLVVCPACAGVGMVTPDLARTLAACLEEDSTCSHP